MLWNRDHPDDDTGAHVKCQADAEAAAQKKYSHTQAVWAKKEEVFVGRVASPSTRRITHLEAPEPRVKTRAVRGRGERGRKLRRVAGVRLHRRSEHQLAGLLLQRVAHAFDELGVELAGVKAV